MDGLFIQPLLAAVYVGGEGLFKGLRSIDEGRNSVLRIAFRLLVRKEIHSPWFYEAETSSFSFAPTADWSDEKRYGKRPPAGCKACARESVESARCCAAGAGARAQCNVRDRPGPSRPPHRLGVRDCAVGHTVADACPPSSRRAVRAGKHANVQSRRHDPASSCFRLPLDSSQDSLRWRLEFCSTSPELESKVKTSLLYKGDISR